MPLAGRVCVVTGATSGIGRALAIALAKEGAQVWALGRSSERLSALVEELGLAAAVPAVPVVGDLEQDDDLAAAVRRVLAGADRVDVLAHCAGTIALGEPASIPAREVERMTRVNLEAPLVLTHALLPALRGARGHVVFLNSSAVDRPSRDNSLYAATKQELKTAADGLRAELGPDGVRVLSVFVGRTATPMQERVHEHEGRIYRPELLLRPEDVVQVILGAVTLPATAEVTDVSVRSTSRLADV